MKIESFGVLELHEESFWGSRSSRRDFWAPELHEGVEALSGELGSVWASQELKLLRKGNETTLVAVCPTDGCGR